MNVYKVTLGMIEEKRVYHDQGRVNVRAKDAKEAIAKADKDLKRGEMNGREWAEVFEGIEYVLTIDID